MGMMVRLLANLRKVRMKRGCLFTLVVFCFTAYQVQGQIKWDAAKFMSLSEVKLGMKGRGYTVP